MTTKKFRCEACRDMKCDLKAESSDSEEHTTTICVFCPFDGDAADWREVKE